jgi:hypothetical protein
MHQTNQRGHNETSTATTQNQLAYKACRRWREVSARPDATPPLNILGYNTLTNAHWISAISSSVEFLVVRCLDARRPRG